MAGVQTSVLEGGPRHRDEAVVFVHGNPGAGRDWAELAGRVSALARVVAPDMPGFADADKPSGFAYTPDAQARFIDGLLDQLAVSRVHLVLHDLGGFWGLTWAASHPSRLASVTLLNTGAMIGYRWHRIARLWRTPVVGEALMLAARDAAIPVLLRRQNRTLAPRHVKALAEQARAADKRAVLRIYRSTDADASAMAATLRPFDVPALVIYGDRDPYVPVDQAAQQRAAFPSARIEILGGHGHWCFLEEPERTANLVIPFLREHLAGGGEPDGPA